MRVPFVLIAVAIVIAAAVFGRSSSVESEVTETDRTPSTVSDIKGIDDEIVDSSGTPVLTLLPTPTSTPKPAVESTPLLSLSTKGYVYPGAAVISENDNTIEMQSSSDTDEITDWYSEKLMSLGMNVNTRVKTRANDKVLNKLVVSGTSGKVSVEVSKEDGSSQVRIIVLFI